MPFLFFFFMSHQFVLLLLWITWFTCFLGKGVCFQFWHERKVSQEVKVVQMWSRLTTGQRPGQSHHEVAQVVWMAHDTPPARHDQALPCSRGDGFQIWNQSIWTRKVGQKQRAGNIKSRSSGRWSIKSTGTLTRQFGVWWVPPERVLLRVGFPEDVEANDWKVKRVVL